jgi:hypothetical protein
MKVERIAVARKAVKGKSSRKKREREQKEKNNNYKQRTAVSAGLPLGLARAARRYEHVKDFGKNVAVDTGQAGVTGPEPPAPARQWRAAVRRQV